MEHQNINQASETQQQDFESGAAEIRIDLALALALAARTLFEYNDDSFAIHPSDSRASVGESSAII